MVKREVLVGSDQGKYLSSWGDSGKSRLFFGLRMAILRLKSHYLGILEIAKAYTQRTWSFLYAQFDP